MSQAENPLVDCPLDKYHRIQKSRLQFHLVKCIKNHTLSTSTKVKCPFNPLHIVETVEIMHHCKTCPDSASVVLEQYDLEGPKNFSGVLSLDDVNQQINASLPQTYKQEKFTINTSGYDPTVDIENKPVYRTLMCESKSKRKEFRIRERQRFAEIEANNKVLPKNASPAATSEVWKPLRPPRNISKSSINTAVLEIDTMKEQTHNKNENQVSNFDEKMTKTVMSKIVKGKEGITLSLAENPNNQTVTDISNTKDKSATSVNFKTSNNDGNKEIQVVTDTMNHLRLSKKTENNIKERKNTVINFIAANSTTNPSGSTFSYRDAAILKSNTAGSRINTTGSSLAHCK